MYIQVYDYSCIYILFVLRSACALQEIASWLGSMMRCAYTALLFAAAAQAFTLPGTPVTRTAGMSAFLCVRGSQTFGTCKRECL